MMVVCVLRFGTRIPQELVQLVESCWSPDFEDRPEVLPHRLRASGMRPQYVARATCLRLSYLHRDSEQALHV